MSEKKGAKRRNFMIVIISKLLYNKAE